MRTIEEIENLKSGWAEEPVWDIEATEGFEDHKEELRNFRIQKEMEWEKKAQANREKIAEILGCPGNVALARYVMSLEERVASLDTRLDKLEWEKIQQSGG